jgi:nitrite reductase/ring-hydroxylating ferredoxin subunit/uncharacterized membrane protein
MRELRIVKLLTRLEEASVFDPLIDKVTALFSAVLRPRELRDLLHGVPLGHPLHPVAVQIPIGAWTSAAVLDAAPESLVPGADRASRALVGLGVVSAIPAVAAGWTDWLHLHEQQKRVGLIHAAANATAVALYTASFIQRSRGRQASGKALGYLGFAVVSGAGFIGGHLSYRQAAGANHTEDVPHRFPQDWQVLAPLSELPDNELSRMDVAGLPLLVLRRGESVEVLSNVCSHLSGPLNEGELLNVNSAEPCVECPWHGSVFSLNTGYVVHGPATAPQPKFQTRVAEGVVQILLPNAG